MRNDAIARVIDKLNEAQQAKEALEAAQTRFLDEVPGALPELPDEATGEPVGPPDIVPASRPDLPNAATPFSEETRPPDCCNGPCV